MVLGLGLLATVTNRHLIPVYDKPIIYCHIQCMKE